MSVLLSVMDKPYMPMHYGFQCGLAWWPLLNRFSTFHWACHRDILQYHYQCSNFRRE